MIRVALRLPFLLLAAAQAAAVLPAQFAVRDAGPQPDTANEAVCFDRLRGVLVVRTDLATYEYDGAGWRSVATAALPPARSEEAVCFDGQRLLLYGGQDAAATPALDDFWAYDGTNWTPVPTSGPTPGRRRGHAMAYDAARQRVVLFGGTDMQGGFPSDTWEWDGVSWTQMPFSGPQARVWHRLAYDPVRQKVVMVDGALNPTIFTETWEYDASGWTLVSSTQPPARIFAGLAYDAARGALVRVGGQDPFSLAAPVDHVYDAATRTWSPLPVANPLPAFLVTGADYDPVRQQLVVLGNQGVAPFTPPETWLVRSSGALQASAAPFGTGCVGTSTGPTATPLQLRPTAGCLPLQGTRYALEVPDVGQAPLALLCAGTDAAAWNGQPLPLDLGAFGLPGCPLFVAPLAVAVMAADGQGGARQTLAIPVLPALAGFVLHHQALVVDPAAPNGLGATSNRLTATLQ